MRTRVVSLAIVLLVAAGGTASAQAPGTIAGSRTSADTTEVTERYGLQLFAVDAFNSVLVAAEQPPELLLGSYLLGGPIVHLLHRNTKGAVASLTLRALLPAAGVYLGAQAAKVRCKHSPDYDDDIAVDMCGLAMMFIGGAIGGASALLIDYFYLAKKTRRVQRPDSLIRVGSLRANPDLGVGKHGSLRLGLRGSW